MIDLFSRTENSFEYPVYNIFIQALDYDKILKATYVFQNKKSIKMTDFLEARIFEYKTDAIAPHQFVMSPDQHEITQGRFFIKIHSRSKTVIQKIIIVRHENNSYAGYSVVDLEGTLLKEFIYNNPPKKIQEEIKYKLNEMPNKLDLIYTQ